MRYTTAVASTFAFIFLFVAVGQAQPLEDDEWAGHLDGGVLLVDNEFFDVMGEGIFLRGNRLAQAHQALFDQNAERATTFVLSGSLVRWLDSGFGIGAQATWSPLGQVDANFYLYSAKIKYGLPMGDFGLYAGTGIGGATLSFTADDESIFEESAREVEQEIEEQPEAGSQFADTNTNLYIPASLGIQWNIAPDLTLTAEAQDNIIFGEGGFDANNVLHTPQFTAGFTFGF